LPTRLPTGSNRSGLTAAPRPRRRKNARCHDVNAGSTGTYRQPQGSKATIRFIRRRLEQGRVRWAGLAIHTPVTASADRIDRKPMRTAPPPRENMPAHLNAGPGARSRCTPVRLSVRRGLDDLFESTGWSDMFATDDPPPTHQCRLEKTSPDTVTGRALANPGQLIAHFSTSLRHFLARLQQSCEGKRKERGKYQNTQKAYSRINE